MSWSQRLKRVFEIDIETCQQCGGHLRVIASIEQAAVIERILDHLGHTVEPIDPAHPSRAPPRAIAWSERFVLFITTRATMQGRAGVGLRRDAPAFPGEREGFARLNDEGSGRLRTMAASTCRQQTGCSSLQRLRPSHNGPLYELSATSSSMS